MTQDKETFLGRWSRLKQEHRQAPAAPNDAGTGAAPGVVAETHPADCAAPPALPPVAELKPDADFRPFMDPRVGVETRREALKKLFADPHFNLPDPFEPYSADLTAEDPISPEMLKTLNHARRLLFDEGQVQEEPLPDAKDVAGRQDA